ncbi:hypothetical protein E2C01_028959 [Portunus trituberculatus]|uniref:Uncharacterized protein n=1 Tax=Portunus trituberculatus TaxID=210409 RepID=A0A5B7ETB5_PORTR|nr:hypothetical protein [Portunus trituberculatus]
MKRTRWREAARNTWTEGLVSVAAGRCVRLAAVQTISAVEFKNGVHVACVFGVVFWLHCVTFSQNSRAERNETHSSRHSYTHSLTRSPIPLTDSLTNTGILYPHAHCLPCSLLRS